MAEVATLRADRPLRIETTLTWTGAFLAPSEHHRWALRRTQSGLAGELEAPFYGDPAPSEADAAQLWNFEVAELFLAGAGGQYTELELSPHGLHLLLRFEAPRVRRPENKPPSVEDLFVERAQDRWTARFLLPWALLPGDLDRACSFGLHGPPDRRRHLVAARLPGDVPDFHQPEHFPRLPEAFCGRPG